MVLLYDFSCIQIVKYDFRNSCYQALVRYSSTPLIFFLERDVMYIQTFLKKLNTIFH